MGGKKTYARKIKRLFGSSLIAYWPLNETSGTVAYDVSGNARNGAYTGVDLANAAAPAKIGGMAPYFDGTNDYCNIYSASLASAFSGAAGSLFIWAKIFNAGIWTDASYDDFFRIAADANNEILLRKTNANNALYTRYNANGTTKSVTRTNTTTIDWFLFGFTWSKAADQMIAYYNGAQTGATQTGLDTWAGAPAAATCVIGAYVLTPANPWNGWLNQAIILNRIATPAEVLAMYNAGV
jgi:hypothetical protein